MGSDEAPSYFWLIQARWRSVLLIAAACGALSLLAAAFMPRTYEASVTLMVNPPPFKETEGQTSDEPTDLAEMMPRTLPVEMYRIIALSDALIKDVVDRIEGEHRPLEELKDQLRVELVELGSRSPVRGTQYAEAIVLHVKAESPELAASFTQEWADLFKQRVDALTLGRLHEIHDLIGEMWSNARGELEEAEEALASFREQWNLVLMKQEQAQRQNLLTELQVEAERTDLAIAGWRAELTVLREELAGEKRIEELFKAPPDEAYWLAGEVPGGGDGAPEIDASSGLRTQQYNPVHTQTRVDEVKASSTLSAREARKRKIVQTIGKLEKEIESLQKLIARRELEFGRLSRNAATSLETHELLARKVEKAKIALRNESSDIEILGGAVEPESPIDPHPASRALVGVLIGMLLGSGYVVAEAAIAGRG